jgi:CRP-like cAMP-binding protein
MGMLAGNVLFRDAPEAWQRRIEAASIAEEIRDGSMIFAEGDAPDTVYAVVGGEGRVRVGSTDRHGKILMVEVFAVGEVFGEIGVIDGGPRTAEALAQGRVRLLRIPAGIFLEALEQAPTLGARLCDVLARRLRRTFGLLQDATFETLEVRLARQLLYLSSLAGRRTAEGLRIAGRFRQPDLADLLGATPRSIITILNAWRSAGLVQYDAAKGRLTIADEQRMTVLAGTRQA